MDDFNFDFGWRVLSTSTSGRWERGIPNGTFIDNKISNPHTDLLTDIGEYAYVTGNADLLDVGSDDVDNGHTTLISPSFDLSEMNNPQIEYALWFFNGGGAGSTPNDFLEVSISDGQNAIVVEEIRSTIPISGDWRDKSKIIVKDYLQDLTNVSISFSVADDEPGHLAEGGVDGFAITEGETTPTKEEILSSKISVSPNPFNHYLNISSEELIESYVLYDVQGKLIAKNNIKAQKNFTINTKDFQPSVYFLELVLNNGSRLSKKIIK